MKEFAIKVLSDNRGKLCLYSVGQAGFVIKSKSGQLLGVDLYLSECVERLEGHIGFKRLLPKILDYSDLTFDCLIATHPHWDHFDADAIPSMISNSKTVLFASHDCRHELRRLGISEDRAIYVAPEDSCVCGDFAIDFVRCDHGDGAPDAVAVVVTVDGKKLYFAGDTCLHIEWKEFFSELGHVDVMAAAINGHFGNMNEMDCAKLSSIIRPEITIPCHYGMFASHGGDVGKFVDIMNEHFPERTYRLMCMGECMELC